MQVMYLGRAPYIKESLPDFLKWCRVTRHPLVFCGLTGSQRTPGNGASQLTWQLNLNTISLRHKHSPETLIIHINQCIHIVLAFTGNARQSILHLKYCFQQKFYFRTFYF